MPFLQGLQKRGFTQYPARSLLQLAYKGATTNIAVDYTNRRVSFQITENTTSPHTNVNEILSVLSEIQYPPEESIQRVDLTGTVTIKVQDGSTTSFLSSIVKKDFIEKAKNILGQEIKPGGIKIASNEPYYTGDISRSPFLILIESLATDASDTKFMVTLQYASNRADQLVCFLEALYDRLKNIIMVSGEN